MELEKIKLIIMITIVIISALTFVFILLLAASHPGKAAVKVYDRINNQLRERKKSFFDYQKMEEFLLKNGASYHLGKWVDPVKYTALKLIMAAAGVFLGVRANLVLACFMAIIFYFLPDLLLIYENKRDNEKIMGELKLVYNSLAVQIRAGVQVTNAIAECYNTAGDKSLRLYDAMLALSMDISMKANVEEALENFQRKFENRYIDSLCVILQQALESGKAVDLLRDVSEQIRDMESAVRIKQKMSLDRHLTFYELGVMTAMIAIVIFACVNYMFTIASGF